MAKIVILYQNLVWLGGWLGGWLVCDWGGIAHGWKKMVRWCVKPV